MLSGHRTRLLAFSALVPLYRGMIGNVTLRVSDKVLMPAFIRWQIRTLIAAEAKAA